MLCMKKTYPRILFLYIEHNEAGTNVDMMVLTISKTRTLKPCFQLILYAQYTGKHRCKALCILSQTITWTYKNTKEKLRLVYRNNMSWRNVYKIMFFYYINCANCIWKLFEWDDSAIDWNGYKLSLISLLFLAFGD